MFKLPGLPSPKAGPHELADLAELLCLNSNFVSQREIVACLGRNGDNDHNLGCDDNDDENLEFLEEVMNEVERRVLACNGGYPFSLDLEGTVLRYDEDRDDEQSILYRYLLLSTRLNMKNKRAHAGIDGTKILEEVASQILRNYLGGERVRHYVFGTAVHGGFKDKINDLCGKIGEGTRFKNLDSGPTQAQDDKLDIVVWVPFADSSPSQLIVFGQCKTGSTWQNSVCELQPDSFIKKWIQDPIRVIPIRAFCISEAADRSKWNSMSFDAGLLLDRCRLVDFCFNLDSSLIDKMRLWTSAAMASDLFSPS